AAGLAGLQETAADASLRTGSKSQLAAIVLAPTEAAVTTRDSGPWPSEVSIFAGRNTNASRVNTVNVIAARPKTARGIEPLYLSIIQIPLRLHLRQSWIFVPPMLPNPGEYSWFFRVCRHITSRAYSLAASSR